MSFDLSQLDRVAKGELGDSQELRISATRTPRPRVRPQLPRRKLREERRQRRGDVDDMSEVTGSRRSEHESAALPHDDSDFALEDEDLPDGTSDQSLGKKRKGPQEHPLTAARKTPKQSRLESLAQLKDVSELPLCTLISRATYLEKQTLLQEARDKKTVPAKAAQSTAPPPTAVPSLLAPQVAVVDGRLVVNEASLECTQPSHHEPTEGYVRVEEGEDRVVNYHSYTDWSATRGAKWSREETELLVQGIGQFGIDFSLLQRLFPNRSRKQIKAKFSRMWKEDPQVFGRHFDKADGEHGDTYPAFVRALQAERDVTANDVTSLALPAAPEKTSDLRDVT